MLGVLGVGPGFGFEITGVIAGGEGQTPGRSIHIGCTLASGIGYGGTMSIPVDGPTWTSPM